MKIYCLSNNIVDENAYIVIRNKDVSIIDPGFNYELISKFLNQNELMPSRILLTHGHFDHFRDLDKLYKAYGSIKTYIHEDDYKCLKDPDLNQSIGLGAKATLKDIRNVFKVKNKDNVDGFIYHHTPGHTKGSSVIEIGNFIFTGDTLFKGTIGRCDLPGGSMNDMNNSLSYIVSSFSKRKVILPGHYSKSTIKDELSNNQFLKPFLKRTGK